jgi:DNA-binding NarL/FixJ family response regulator
MAEPVRGSGPIGALIVEDNPSWQEILAEILSDLGLRVEVVTTLAAAESVTRATPHRLAVVDLSLGDDESSREGLVVLEMLRRSDPGCVPLLLTGYATVELAVSALTEFGAFTCLRKEAFRRAEFREVVARALAQALPVTPSPGPQRPAPVALALVGGGPEADASPILVVEDDAGWRSLLTEILAAGGYAVEASPSYAEASSILRRRRPDAAVVDLGLASSLTPTNRDGYRVLQLLAEQRIPAVVVTGLAGPEEVETLFASFGIRSVLEKRGFDRARFSAEVAAAVAAGRALPGALATLTPREQEVLALLVRGLTNKGIAREMVISENTVKRYLKSVFAKLDVDSRAAAVARALQ